MNQNENQLTLNLPRWVEPFLAQYTEPATTDEQKMTLAIELARLNIAHETGGPFAAAVFQQDSNQLIAVGVNIVEASNCSLAHAEMMALSFAQQKLQTYDLSAIPGKTFELFTSVEPCAMCTGAIPWSGISRVVFGASEQDARAIGFDEGHKPTDWIAALGQRNISVTGDILAAESAAILQRYVNQGGLVYNSKQ